ncbi:hypothetical protein C0J52_21066 [Blattella germanica]|nr:hypothetical protein C0J52_21066 [Blattella germanica]
MRSQQLVLLCVILIQIFLSPIADGAWCTQPGIFRNNCNWCKCTFIFQEPTCGTDICLNI